MHELSLTEKILRLVLTEAETHRAKRVTKIKIVIGELSGILESCVEFYFQLIAKDTPAQGAKLEFTRAEARLYCIHCAKEFKKQPRDFLCPECGSLGRLTASGQECTVESIEVE
ncbi:MAG: hydrogenase maturation nickel metallochaperone HypA [Bacillota bacterium]